MAWDGKWIRVFWRDICVVWRCVEVEGIMERKCDRERGEEKKINVRVIS